MGWGILCQPSVDVIVDHIYTFTLHISRSHVVTLSPATNMSLLVNKSHNVLDGCVRFGAHIDPPGILVYKKLHIFIVKSTLRLIEFNFIKDSYFSIVLLWCFRIRIPRTMHRLCFLVGCPLTSAAGLLYVAALIAPNPVIVFVCCSLHTQSQKATALFHRKVFSPCRCF